jgi:hypothetical protein
MLSSTLEGNDSLNGCASGLRDGLFSNQKSQFGYILEGLGMENVGIYYAHLEYFTAIWYNVWPLVINCGHLVYFFQLWYVWTKKNLATLVRMRSF